jgi:hypothetical protein
MSYITAVRNRVSQFTKITWALIIGLLWLIAALIAWWYVVYESPKNVFEGMLKNNFSTTSVTKHVTTQQNGVRAVEDTQVQLGKDNVTRTLTTLTQGTDTVTTEAISTQTQDYVRYIAINTSRKDAAGKKLSFSSALNTWAKSDNQTASSGQSTAQMMLNIFPVGNVNPSDRKELVKFIENENVFNVKYKTVKKQTIHGRRVYTYQVQLLPQSYVAMLKKFGESAGLRDQVANLNPDDYAGAAPTNLTVTIDAVSRHLTSVTTADGTSSRHETYDAYGVQKPLILPKNTISTTELQQRLSTQ